MLDPLLENRKSQRAETLALVSLHRSITVTGVTPNRTNQPNNSMLMVSLFLPSSPLTAVPDFQHAALFKNALFLF